MGKVVYISLAIAAISALLGERVLNLRKRALASRELFNKHLPNCVTLKNLDFGSEDITVLGDGRAFISAITFPPVTRDGRLLEPIPAHCGYIPTCPSKDYLPEESGSFIILRFVRTLVLHVTTEDKAAVKLNFFHPKINPSCLILTQLPDEVQWTVMDQGLKYPGMPLTEGTGKIFFLDMQDSRMKPVELRMPRNFDLESFNPHGISTYIDPRDDTVYLFVVNHPEHQSQVEVFRFLDDELSLLHVKTIKHELLYSVNDIVAVGVDSFYATNDHYFAHQLLKAFVEPILCQPWSNVVYYSPEEVKVVSEGYYFANGINISPDKRHMYVADIFDHNVHVFERKDDNSLAPVKSVAVGSLCDNIEVDPETGDLWMGCHPNGWKLFVFDPQDPPGSEVIRVQNIDSDEPVVTQVYMDDGHVIMGSSVATVYGGKLLIGSVFHKALCCDLE